MDAVLGRKPLTQAERSEPPCTVCVTGAAGFIASQIVVRLLAAGHSVNATYRKEDDAATLAALKALPQAERIRWFEADLLVQGTFDTAVQGCKYVIHTAAPVVMNVPLKHAYAKSINPMCYGVHNVLSAVNKAPSVERVVMTSSIHACIDLEALKRDPSHVVTEADWNLCFTPEMPYHMGKTLSEWEAWAMAAQQSRWDLVVICPANVLGPPLAAYKGSESVRSAKMLLDGSVWPFVPPLDTPLVDVADIAAAHCLAMVTRCAHGRYIIYERTLLATELAAILREQFPQYWVPYMRAPFWLAAAVFKVTGMLSHGWLRATYGRKTQASSAKALAELRGLGPMVPLEQTLRDMGRALIELGLLPKKQARAPAGGRGPAKAAATGKGATMAKEK